MIISIATSSHSEFTLVDRIFFRLNIVELIEINRLVEARVAENSLQNFRNPAVVPVKRVEYWGD